MTTTDRIDTPEEYPDCAKRKKPTTKKREQTIKTLWQEKLDLLVRLFFIQSALFLRKTAFLASFMRQI